MKEGKEKRKRKRKKGLKEEKKSIPSYYCYFFSVLYWLFFLGTSLDPC